jgi:hypothetical protein
MLGRGSDPAGGVEPWRIEPQTGGSLDPGDVVGRDQVILDALEQIRRGNNLLVTDPRRMGKTAMLTRLSNEPGHGATAVMLSYEGVSSIDQFFERTVRALHEHTGLRAKVMKALGTIVQVEASTRLVKVRAAFDDRSRTDLLGDALSAVETSLPPDERLIVVMDEVPIAIRSIAQNESPEMAAQLLNRLRSLRLESNRLKWVVSGSIGFHHVLRDAHTTEGVINDLQTLPLGPLAPPGAGLLARCLMIGINRAADDRAVATLIEVTGGIPFLLHHVVHGLEPGGEVTERDVRESWTRFIEDRDMSRSMTHLLTRINDEYPPDLVNAAHDVLDMVAAEQPAGVSTEELRPRTELGSEDHTVLLDLLVDDHYLVERDRLFTWRYDVLRRIWVIRRRLGGRR